MLAGMEGHVPGVAVVVGEEEVVVGGVVVGVVVGGVVVGGGVVVADPGIH